MEIPPLLFLHSAFICSALGFSPLGSHLRLAPRHDDSSAHLRGPCRVTSSRSLSCVSPSPSSAPSVPPASVPTAQSLSVPQRWSSALSLKANLTDATADAVEAARSQLPQGVTPDLAIVHACSLYSSKFQWDGLVPQMRRMLPDVKAIIGTTTGGNIGRSAEREEPGEAQEAEGVPSVSVTLASLPDVTIKPFQMLASEIPDKFDPAEDWISYLGVPPSDVPLFFMYSTPRFMRLQGLDNVIIGLDQAYPESKKVGGLASTFGASSSPAIFAWSAMSSSSNFNMTALWPENVPAGEISLDTFAQDGLIGLMLVGDIDVRTRLAHGCRPVSDRFRITKCEPHKIVEIFKDEPPSPQKMVDLEELSETAQSFAALQGANAEKRMSEDGVGAADTVPIDPWSEYTRLTYELDDTDANLIKKATMLGVEQVPMQLPSPSDVSQASSAASSRYLVEELPKASFREGGLLIQQPIQEGQTMRFYVRDMYGAQVDLSETLQRLAYDLDEDATFRPEGLFVLKGLDRGRKLFGKGNYEVEKLREWGYDGPLMGFFGDGAIGPMIKGGNTYLYGSCSLFVEIGPKNPDRTRASTPMNETTRARLREIKRQRGGSFMVSPFTSKVDYSPDNPDPDITLPRRLVNVARPVSISTIEFSLPELAPLPSHRLEEMVWSKEMEVDRLRDRYPMSNLMYQVGEYNLRPANRPRDLYGSLCRQKAERGVALVGECMKASPNHGILKAKYDPKAIASTYADGGERRGVAAVSVHIDNKYYAGNFDDLGAARRGSTVPIIASDIFVYAWQIVRARLAGADAVKLVAAVLSDRDLQAFLKVCERISVQAIVSVSSREQLERCLRLDGCKIVAINNLNFWDMQPDVHRTTRLLTDEMRRRLKEKEIFVLSEGGVDTAEELRAVVSAGADGVILSEAVLRDADPRSAIERMLT
ncbi:unnamed protein product [Vitrella brassicaformis CCMP3155]|uniref:indole-3-glycerol-phosphate synthase n=3 Tax=Vitrella brassicaformis TaxID=1169539 RepID=A0A0G4FH55_VITBC|nr:unnamed protein product [Vitrella brassicaformis CCMP3155]|eukprot:CEM12188.1 unnamed protein product [Vitrella brassicaformis CCMP3155]